MNKIDEALANLNCVHGLHYNADCKMCAILSKTEHAPCNITATEILIRQAQIEEMNFLFKRFWAGRPKHKPLSRIKCPIYIFSFDPGSHYVMVDNFPKRYYHGVDWRGLI